MKPIDQASSRPPTRYSQLTVRLPASLLDQVERSAQERGQSVAAMVEIGLLGILASRALQRIRVNEAQWKRSDGSPPPAPSGFVTPSEGVPVP
jgi:hypothetical protein